MDDSAANTQQLAIWKDKYSRLTEQYSSLLNKNQQLEDRLINVVDKIERDKSLLSDEIDHLAEKLACATNTIDYMKNECARYKSDCMLAVHLLQCQPSFYTSQNLNMSNLASLKMLPVELREKLHLDSGTLNEGAPDSNSATVERKIVHFSASAMTFPPTAVFLQSNEPAVSEAQPEATESRDDVRDVFLNKIRLAPEYQTEKLVQCPKCGFAVVKYDRCTQTIGDSSYLSNSMSAPHLFALGCIHEQEKQKRRSARTSSGDLLIDLSEDEREPASPRSPVDSTDFGSAPLRRQDQQRVRFTASPGVHQHNIHEKPNADIEDVQQPVQRTGTFSMGGIGGNYKNPCHQELTTSITLSDDYS